MALGSSVRVRLLGKGLQQRDVDDAAAGAGLADVTDQVGADLGALRERELDRVRVRRTVDLVAELELEQTQTRLLGFGRGLRLPRLSVDRPVPLLAALGQQ